MILPTGDGRACPASILRLIAPLLAVAALLFTAAAPPSRSSSAEAQEALAIDRVIASMTTDERVGQLVMVNFVGADVSPESDIAALVRDYHIGAVLVSASNGNIINRDDTAGQLATLTNGLQERAFEASRRTEGGSEYFLPLFIAVDNEGDLYPSTHVTHNYTQLPNNMTIGATFDREHAEAAGRVAGRELSAAGINMLLGPVADVLEHPRSGGAGDIGVRSFGGSPPWVGVLSRAYVRGVHEGSAGSMLTVSKHFPGHGGSDRATDAEVPTVTKSLEQLLQSDLAPFVRLTQTGDQDPGGLADALMVSHIRYRSFVPGSTQPFTGPMSFDGGALSFLMGLPEFAGWRPDHLVVADSLGVFAVRQWYAAAGGDFPSRTVVRDALMAGNDLLPLVEMFIDPNSRGWKDYQLPVIQDAILFMRQQYVEDLAFRRRADDALRHLLAAKMKLYPGLDVASVRRDPAVAAEVAGTGRDEMRALAEAALTLIEPRTADDLKARLPQGPVSPDRVLIVECWEDCYAFRLMPKLDLQNHLLRLYGEGGAGRLKAGDVSTISFAELDRWLANPADPANQAVDRLLRESTWMVFALADYNPERFPASDAVKRFLRQSPIDTRNKSLVAIAYNAPYHLDSTEISKLSAYFAVYNKTDLAIETGFRALYGDVTPAGSPPVDVSGIFYRVQDATQADASRGLPLAVYGHEPDAVPDRPTIGLVAGPLLDRNGKPLVDGTPVSFTLTREGGAPRVASAMTSDGFAGVEMAASGTGAYTATATSSGVASEPLSVRIVDDGEAAEPPTGAVDAGDGDGGTGWPVLALAIGVPSLAAAAAAGGGAFVLYRRRTRAQPQPATREPAVPAADHEPATPPALRVDPDTRRVYVKGVEARPPFSSEQFRLLSYLYERAGKVVGREELVSHVWPEAHSEGVSEEALDALVRRVRERIAQAGGERSYIVTLRGQGFRLDAEDAKN